MNNSQNIPSKDSLFDNFQTDLVTAVTDNATAWGITTGELTALTAAQTPWTGTWAIAKNKDNRTSAQVLAKITARKNYEAVLRPFIQTRIQGNPLMTAADKLLCGIKPRDTVRTRIPVPTGTPLITIVNEAGNSVVIYFHPPQGEPGSTLRGKPKGVTGMVIAIATDVTEPPKNPDECNNREILTRSPKRYTFDPGARGKTVYFFACWVNAKGEQGPWTNLQQFTIW